MRPPDDTEKLLERVRQGERDPFAEVVRRYEEPLRRVCYLMLHCSVKAEDAVQETFARALEHVDQFRGEGSPRSWLYAIALNLCRKRFRDEESGQVPADTEALNRGKRLRVRPRGILTSLIRRETAQRLVLALGHLGETQKEVFVLHYVEELSYEEVARILHTTPGTARVLAHRARAVLRERLHNPDF